MRGQLKSRLSIGMSEDEMTKYIFYLVIFLGNTPGLA